MDPREKDVRRKVKAWRRREVTVLPVPWVFTGKRVRPAASVENRWRAARAPGGLVLSRSGRAHAVEVPFSEIRAVGRGGGVFLDSQLLIVRKHVQLLPLPPRYWLDS